MMSSPSTEALTAGYLASALAAALAKKLMKPSLMPLALMKSSCSALRIAITLPRLTSLNEVSMAVEFFDSIRRSAMRLRMRVIGTRSSGRAPPETRSEEHTSELQSLMRISYAVFCLKKKKKIKINTDDTTTNTSTYTTHKYIE